MLLHDQKSEDSIKQFFTEVYELYVKVKLFEFASLFTKADPFCFIKVLMNPFYEKNTTITNPSFDNRIKLVARRFL